MPVVPLSQYLATSYRPDCEYLDGELLERNVGEWDHGRLQVLVSRYLCNREKQWDILVVLAQRVQVTPTRFRVPDISVLAGAPPDIRSLWNLLSCASRFCLPATP
jgi:hypothetical protein